MINETNNEMDQVIKFLKEHIKHVKITELLENVIDQLERDREDGISLRTSCKTLSVVFGAYTALDFLMGEERNAEACAVITILATKIWEMIDIEDWDYDKAIEFLEKAKHELVGM